MTYQQLLDYINLLSDDQKNSDVTIFDGDQGEFLPAKKLEITSENDILEENHPFITI